VSQSRLSRSGRWRAGARPERGRAPDHSRSSCGILCRAISS
jgi:hypothetical protein